MKPETSPTRIRDIAPKERPRERLRRMGAAALSNAELLAILLRTGTQGASVLEVASRLLQEFDDHGDTVMFACGEPFYGTPGKGINEVRMAYVIKREDLERGMDILAVAIERYRREVMGL